MIREYPLNARLWLRDSTEEWVMEIDGSINDTYLSVRHTMPAQTDPAEVPGLDRLYEEIDRLKAEVERFRSWFDDMGRR